MQKKLENMGENVFKFWTTEILKELVTLVGNEPVLINTFFHYGIIWIKKKWCLRGHDFEKSKNLLITPPQTIGHKTPSLETFFLNSSEIRQRKNDEFWKKLIFGNLVCIKTCYSSKPAKNPFHRPNTSHRTTTFQNCPWLMPRGKLIEKLPIF